MAEAKPAIYSGTSFAVIDGKGRIAVPAGLRNIVPEIEADGRRERLLYVGHHEKLPCLVAYGQDRYDLLTQEIEDRRMEARELRVEFDPDTEHKKRFAWTERYVLDGSGRFSPSTTHRRRCGTAGTLAFVGAGRRFEIWSLTRLVDCPDADPDLKEIAAEILAEGGGR